VVTVNHGGKRPGAGRRKGTPNRASAAREKNIARSGMTPIDTMIAIMRLNFGIAQEELKKDNRNDAKIRWAFSLALEAAAKSAPFAHQRFAPIDQRETLDMTRLKPEEIALVESILCKTIVEAPLAGPDEPSAEITS
jgi:hypothetical protein